MKKTLLHLVTIGLLFALPVVLRSDEGMWLLDQLQQLPWDNMRSHGLSLTAGEIYTPGGGSLAQAVVQIGGGSGSFVSDRGLIVTNHHVAYRAIQSVSSVEDDYLKNGFYAQTLDEELPISSYSARVLMSATDVTKEVLSALTDSMNAGERARAIQSKIGEIQKNAKQNSNDDVSVSELYNGLKYHLLQYRVLTDVRLVYAPPTSIGNYGGEVDNWMWPRHTGDFSFMRAYVGPDGNPAAYAKENIPFTPSKFLAVSIGGFQENDFAMVMGYPGRTYRYRSSAEIEYARDQMLPLTIQIYETRMQIIGDAGKTDRKLEIQYASAWRGLANTSKNYKGTLEGIVNSHVIDRRREQEQHMMAFIHGTPALNQRYGTVLSDIAHAHDTLRSFGRKQMIMSQIAQLGLLRIANRIAGYAASFKEDSTGHRTPLQQSSDVAAYIDGVFKNLNIDVDRKTMVALLELASELPAGQHVDFLTDVVEHQTGVERHERIQDFVDRLYRKSDITTIEGCRKLLEDSDEDILDDRFVQFALEFEKEHAPVQERLSSFNTSMNALRRTLIEAIMAWKGENIYPDANRTLRFTFGTVKPYSPRDAVEYSYQTTLTGVIEKETGTDPFIVPEKLKGLWERREYGRYADPRIHDVPVAFLADLDITGGNSGSPVMNGKGELIGLAFDGNWEAVVGDYYYQEPLNRSINVDTRYILFILDRFSGATTIINELTIH